MAAKQQKHVSAQERVCIALDEFEADLGDLLNETVQDTVLAIIKEGPFPEQLDDVPEWCAEWTEKANQYHRRCVRFQNFLGGWIDTAREKLVLLDPEADYEPQPAIQYKAAE